MSAHTPGPWRVEKPGQTRLNRVFGPGRVSVDNEICVLYGDTKQAENALLIAAAPDLLDAAKAVLGHLDGSTGEIDAVLVLQLAIAKAEGREP